MIQFLLVCLYKERSKSALAHSLSQDADQGAKDVKPWEKHKAMLGTYGDSLYQDSRYPRTPASCTMPRGCCISMLTWSKLKILVCFGNATIRPHRHNDHIRTLQAGSSRPPMSTQPYLRVHNLMHFGIRPLMDFHVTRMDNIRKQC
jgi:hypothetical protein